MRAGLSLNRVFSDEEAGEDEAEPDSWMVALCCGRVLFVHPSEHGRVGTFHVSTDRRMHRSRPGVDEDWQCLTCGCSCVSADYMVARRTMPFCSVHNQRCTLIVDLASWEIFACCTTIGGHALAVGCSYTLEARRENSVDVAELVLDQDEVVVDVDALEAMDDDEVAVGLNVLDTIVDSRIETRLCDDVDIEMLESVLHSGLEG